MKAIQTVSRRAFVGALAAACAPGSPAAETTQKDPNGFFTLGRRKGRWFFITPDGAPFFSIGFNHIDSSTLRYPENSHIWRDKYGGSQTRWIRESVAPNLKKWGFNTAGWVQEVSIRQHAHTRAFTLEEYQALEMPYCHLLPFIESHQWEQFHRHMDFDSSEFEDWCDYVARDACGQMANETNLIGYFYSDCPTWVHTRPHNEWRGPIFDPGKLASAAGRAELKRLAARYYKVTHDAIRRYDPHHLILGDRYEANAPLPMEVVEAADPYVDVLSFQDFRTPAEHLRQWYRKTGKPVLWADGDHFTKMETRLGTYKQHDTSWYAAELAKLRSLEGCVGAHLCAAYIANRFRRHGFLDEQEKPDTEVIEQFVAAHRETGEWVEQYR